ncbi:type I restriction endonuclease subunit R [Roseiflexus sp. RS-1]|uniref:type I restriction endonuclease subunit R n=1 Tax=Roseiflexus sp. (strain RS-1) TaxID=357808 RepID=UPI0001533FA4|nr:type I restriction endonuclease subunit R [Roseiflexus sp. RS-1]ABQ91061.1 type I site-specific deoxyribonuclease, HsdR family [Roseiflexus sp. RS-1]
MTLSSERRVVQISLIRYAEEARWEYLSPGDALSRRGGLSQPFLRDVLMAKLQELNPGVITSAEQADDVIARLVRLRPDIEGNREAWEYLKGLKTVFVQAERRERNLRLLDPQQVEANTFHVTDEFRFHIGPHKIRADVVFLVNGIPVILVETKAATRLEGIAEALDQVRRYHREAPDLLVQTQLFALTQLVEFFYGATWSLSRKALFNWREEVGANSNSPRPDFETLVKSFVARRRVLRVLTDYILFARKDGELSKIVLRPHQMRAVERCLSRARDPQKRRGLIWHTQGSGKTYTMLNLARLLLETPAFQNPTVLLIVDRNELQSQLFQNLEAIGFGKVHLALSKRHLRDLLEADTRGVIVSMIHKFDDIPENLNARANIFVLVDEAHRSTGGDLGNYLMGALPNATFIGFTGTPIDRTAHGQGTFKTFGADDPQGYLDKYSIRESIEDGTTVPLHYQLAPNDLIANREAMEKDFWAAAGLEGVADVEELNRVLDRAVTLTNMLKNRERVDKIAHFVAGHFRTYVQPMGYKAFLVAVDRESCCFYKEALDRLYKEAPDRYLPPEASAVVISAGHNDPPHIKRYHLSEDEESRIRKAFRKPDENPQILIVTEKLLTGYDAPILYCMYLDKPMRDHVLLQAIARVNRPYESEDGRRKTTGLILDFVGVFENLERALAFDSKDVSGVVEGLEVLQERFAQLMAQGRAEYLPLTAGKTEDKAAEAALEHFRNKEHRETFYAFFREVQEIYEILSPDPFLRPFLEDYERLVEMYRLVRSAYEPHVPVDKSFLRKTAKIVQQHTRTSQIREPQATYEIGPAALLALLHEDKPDTVKVFNLLKELHCLVADEAACAPHLIPIGERAEEIRRHFEERLISAQEALQHLDKVVRQLQTAQEERRSSPLSPQAFAVEWWLRTQGTEAEKAAQTAASLEEAFARFPNWTISVADERELRTRLYKALLSLGVKEIVAWADRILDLLRRAIE